MALDDQTAAAELREIVGLLRENLEWQAASGVVGFPRGGGVRRIAPAVVDRAVAEEPELPRELPGAGDDRPIVQRPVRPAATKPEAAAAPAPAPAPVRPPEHVPPERRAVVLAELASQVKGCTLCELHAGRIQTVFSRGNPTADLMIVGEGPGAEEDEQGEPFVGPAGQLLDKMIGAMGYARDEVYIANIVKCRPPGNRTPQAEEMKACAPYLHRQIEVVSPRVILAMGNTAVRGLLGVTEGIMRLRGKWKLYRGRIPVMPTYHPAYLLREQSAKRDAKREVWDDLKSVLANLGRTVPSPRKG